MTTYCAPCITELALVREAVTAVSGTASCMAHAILLTHPTDDPGRRRQRLGQLRDLAAVKAETASPQEQVQLELLVHEYSLASAMDMGPSRRPDGQRRPGESRFGESRPDRPGEEGARRPGKSRRGRPRPGERPDGERALRSDGRPGAAPGAEGAGGGGAAPAGDGAALAQAASNGDDPAPVMPSESATGSEGAGLPPAQSSAAEPSAPPSAPAEPATASARAEAPEPTPAAAPASDASPPSSAPAQD